MKILGLEIGGKKQKEPKAYLSRGANYGHWGQSFAISFDGEKNAGEIGPILDYRLNHKALAARSWQAYLESEIARTVLNRFTVWVIARGLKLQCSPARSVLESEGVKLDTEQFNEVAESRFTIWSKSKHSSYSGEETLNELAKTAFKQAKIGGDALVVLRYESNTVKVEVIDSCHLSDICIGYTIPKENTLKHGVEVNDKGEHIAYHVNIKGGKTQRVLARNNQGLRVAFLVYGSKYRTDNVRGLPIISTSLETLKKVERYKEAAVGSAEERQKIAYAIEHNQFSDGTNPMGEQLAALFDANNANNSGVPIDAQGEAMANKVAATTNKQAFNMPVGSSLKSLESKNEMFFKEFYGTNADIVCGAIGIPPNVAFSIYNDSFSASRAATKDWEHTMGLERDNFQTQFYDYVFAFWLHTEILKNKIQAPGYIIAFNNNNWMITESYLNARFTGPMFPHIDPLKEVKAERAKLGSKSNDIPLTTIEMATESLMGGDSYSNMEQYSKELEKAKKLNIIEPIETENNNTDNNKE